MEALTSVLSVTPGSLMKAWPFFALGGREPVQQNFSASIIDVFPHPFALR